MSTRYRRGYRDAEHRILADLQAARDLGKEHGLTYWNRPLMFDMPGFRTAHDSFARDVYWRAFEFTKTQVRAELRKVCGETTNEANP